MDFRSKSFPFYIFIFGFFLLMIAPFLLSHGMFMDGIIYATISNNLANDIGTMTDLFFTNTSMAHFREHPPLAFWIQSLFYRTFGDSFIIEKLYSALTYIITGLIIRKIWITITNNKSMAWLPLLLWISIPIITQAARNNFLENTMMVFTTAALSYLVRDKLKLKLVSLIMAGLMIYFAFMTKGFVALFLWSTPFWYFIFNAEFKLLDFIKNTLLMICFTILPFAIMCLISPSTLAYFIDYFDIQIANSLLNVQTVDSRFWILKKLLKELITPAILMGVIILISKILKPMKLLQTDNRFALILLSLGLSGIVPIIISLKQSGFYSIPAFAILSISFALFIRPHALHVFEKINPQHWAFQFFRVISVLGIGVGLFITVLNYDKNGRDADKLNDIHKIANIVGHGYNLDGNYVITKDWTILSYFYRYYKINIFPTSKPTKPYYLSLIPISEKLPTYSGSNSDLNFFKLYEKK